MRLIKLNSGAIHPFMHVIQRITWCVLPGCTARDGLWEFQLYYLTHISKWVYEEHHGSQQSPHSEKMFKWFGPVSWSKELRCGVKVGRTWKFNIWVVGSLHFLTLSEKSRKGLFLVKYLHMYNRFKLFVGGKGLDFDFWFDLSTFLTLQCVKGLLCGCCILAAILVTCHAGLLSVMSSMLIISCVNSWYK